MGKKILNVGILFGGKSAEHEVSLQSAKNIIQAIDKKKYNPVLIGIDKKGRWILNNDSQFLLNADKPQLIKLNQANDIVGLLPQSRGELSNISKGISCGKLDVVFPILHGPFGEDGTVQGLLKLADIPFIGAGVLGSAVGMDKDVMKRLLRDSNIPISRFICLKQEDNIPEYNYVNKNLGIPCFIKPANLGSSVGVSKANDQNQYEEGMKQAFKYDTKILIEEYIEGREIECAVLGNEQPIASMPGEIILNADFYSYRAKYIDENGAVLAIPAQLPGKIIREIRQLAIKTFKTLGCAGLARVDFFLSEKKGIIVNEINTMPGFTKISMYPKLWENSGISYTELIDRLIQLAIRRFEKEKKLKTDYCAIRNR